MKKFLVLGFAVFAALFLAVACDDDGGSSGGGSDHCQSDCNKNWQSYGYATLSDCVIDCHHYENGGSELNEYISECINAGHSKEDCEAWYYED